VSATNTDTNQFSGNAVAGVSGNYAFVTANANANAETTLRAKFFGVRKNNRFTYDGVVYDSNIYSQYSDFRDVITKDNVRMDVDAAVFYQVTDPKQYAYGIKQPLFALQKLAVTTLRNIIGTLELDEVLSSREFINTKLRATLDEATDAWGIKITRVEIESIVPPPQIQAAMEQQATAEREKRATILTAEATKQKIILEAEATKKANVLAAEAEKQRKILEAEGRLKEKELEALGIKALNENCPNDSVIRLKAIQAMEEVADGNATKIIIPSEMQGLVGLANGLVEGAR
jgi:regulator of protease activity HflC (stomatin/prohibitin superfamily)